MTSMFMGNKEGWLIVLRTVAGVLIFQASNLCLTQGLE
jgi:hypothetical protein